VSHPAVCPEISPVHCAEAGGLPDHSHHQTMVLTRLNGLLAVGLGKGLQAKVELPLDLKRMSIEYLDHSGAPYTPPYAGNHHRNETLTGLGDGRVQLEVYTRLGESWVVGGGLGASVPTGRTEEDPYALAAQSLKHQHIQMGSGTVDPVGSLTAVYGGHQWGMTASMQGRMPVMHSAKDYKPVGSVSTSVGPTYQITSKLMLLGGAEVLWESQAYWGDRPDPMSGRTAIVGAGGAVYRFNPTVAVMGQARVTAAQWSVADQINQRFIGVAGVTITPQKP
jgi:hypothetical protein